jgi:hypothetical protein
LGVTDNQLSVEVYDALGRLVTLSVVEGQTSTIPLNLSKGRLPAEGKRKRGSGFLGEADNRVIELTTEARRHREE